MFGVPPETDPKKKPKNPAPPGNLSLISLVFTGILLVYVYASCAGHMNDTETASPTPANYQPPKPMPATVVDNGAGALVVYPPTMTSNSREITNQMLAVLGEWQKQHREYAVSQMIERGDPSDYNHCWIVSYR